MSRPAGPQQQPRESAFGGVHTSVGATDERSRSTRAVAVADALADTRTTNTNITQLVQLLVGTFAVRTSRRANNASRKEKHIYMTLNGGSLGSWIDEERSKVR